MRGDIVTSNNEGYLTLPCAKISTKEDARQYAIDYQNKYSKKASSYGEIAEQQAELRKIGKRFGLLNEFKENGLL